MKVEPRDEMREVVSTAIPRGFSFFVTIRKKDGPKAGIYLLLYNVNMSEIKAVRLTETVKAAG